MKRLHSNERDDAGEEAGARARDPRPLPSTVRTSGVYARGEGEAKGRGEPTLASLAAAGPCRTFAEVCRRYGRFIWLKIQRPRLSDSEAEEIHQRVFVTMHTLTRERGVPDEVGLVLLGVMKNHIRTYLRDRGRHDETFGDELDDDDMPSSKPDPEQLLDRAQAREAARQRVEAILARMPADLALVFRLIEIEGLSSKEATARLGRSLGAIDVQLHRARAKFTELAPRTANASPRGSR